MIRASRLVLAAVSASLLAVPDLAAQSSEEVVANMVAAYEERISSVENYTMVQDVMGVRSEMYFEKVVRDGRPYFELRSTSSGGGPVESADNLGFSDLYADAPDLAEHARYGGTERIGASEAHVLVIDDVQAMDLEMAGAAGEAGFAPRTGRLFIDAERWVPLRMQFTGDVETSEGLVEITSDIELADYREVGGMLLPYRTAVHMQGLGAAVDPEARAQLEQMREQLDALPESQRALVEEMMSGQMEQLESLLSGDGDMTVEMAVVEVRVNEGPPS